jgi:hypothetical protein
MQTFTGGSEENLKQLQYENSVSGPLLKKTKVFPSTVEMYQERHCKIRSFCLIYRLFKAYIGFWWENLRERDHLVDPGVDGRILLRRVFRK